jgi:predicted nucleic acid-binding Zn ribbon protein
MPSPDMERASKLIRSLKLPEDTISDGELAAGVWRQAAGAKIAAHTRPARMVRGRLIVEVEDNVWQRQLFALTAQILKNLAKNLGPGVVEDLEFRVVPPRRAPGRATVAANFASQDEADAIGDPVLRGIYKASRKKALG